MNGRPTILCLEMEEKMNVRIRSLYLCVTDMDRAIDFYEKFLERSVLKLSLIHI